MAERERAGAESLAGYMLGEATTRLRALGRLDILDGIAGSALTYLDSSSAGSFDADRVALRAEGLLQIGEIRLVKGDAASAHDAFVRAADSVRTAASRAPSDPALLRVAGKASYWLGYEAFQRRDYALAQTQWQSYRESAQRLFDLRPDDPEAWKELGYAYNNLGTLAYRRGELDAAQQAFERSIELKKRALEHGADDADTALDLGDSLSWSANVEDARGELRQARDRYVQAGEMIARAHRLRDGDSALEYRQAVALFQVSQASLAIGDVELAKSANADAQARMERLAGMEPANLSWQRSAAYAYVQTAMLDLLEPSGAHAEDRNEAALAILSRLVEQQPSNSDWGRLYGLALLQRGALAARARQVERARRAYAAASEHVEALLRAHDDDALSRALAARTHLQEASVAVDGWAEQRAIAAAVAALEPVATQSRDRRVLDPWARSLIAAGRVREAQSVLLRLRSVGYRQPGIVDYYDRYLTEPRPEVRKGVPADDATPATTMGRSSQPDSVPVVPDKEKT